MRSSEVIFAAVEAALAANKPPNRQAMRRHGRTSWPGCLPNARPGRALLRHQARLLAQLEK